MERVEPEDFQWKYRCSTRDELSGETATSATWAKLIRSGKLPYLFRAIGVLE